MVLLLIANAASSSLAQEPDIHAIYSTVKGACGAAGTVEISAGRIKGPDFECTIQSGQPAGTGLVAYQGTCRVDGKQSTDGLAMDLGNYDDHFELSLPGREDWLALYPCSPVPGLN
jgi:hypothetical protein